MGVQVAIVPSVLHLPLDLPLVRSLLTFVRQQLSAIGQLLASGYQLLAPAYGACTFVDGRVALVDELVAAVGTTVTHVGVLLTPLDLARMCLLLDLALVRVSFPRHPSGVGRRHVTTMPEQER